MRYPGLRQVSHPGMTRINSKFVKQSIPIHASAFSPRDAPELCRNDPPKRRGRGECRVPVAPAAACAVIESTRVSHHGRTGITRHSRTRWCYGLFRALPGDRAFLPPSRNPFAPSRHRSFTDLTPASGRQDHTTSPSASAPFVRQICARPRPSHPLPHVRDDRETPLCVGRDGGGYSSDLGEMGIGIFLQGGTGLVASA